MVVFSKESLETLKQRIDLIEVMTPFVDFKRSGAAYKALCPFHDEKTPSFMIQKGDSHYHCFGCGAHGDAIQFLMSHQQMSFREAVESLAQRFGIRLETVDDPEEKKGPDKALLREALETACRFYQFCLLHTPEGHDALSYLYSRGIDLEFINNFRIGLSPKVSGPFRKAMESKSIGEGILFSVGLLAEGKGGQPRDFFYDRIMFPIHNPAGHVIGFSGRKYKEETFGGKYVNTPETPLFKKSKVLFGLNYSRRRIAKERKAIVVEGQIDALRLIHAGFNFTVAGQGTAFGEGHVQELVTLGVQQVYLALDPDTAGQEATYKIGQFFQKEGVEARIVKLPAGSDPDAFIRENGPDAFAAQLDSSIDYLSFLIGHLSKEKRLDSPAAKNDLIKQISKLIREWKHPVMVHETLRQLARRMQVPEEMIGVGQDHLQHIYVKRSSTLGETQAVDPDRVLETDLLRWILLLGKEQPRLVELVQANILESDLRIPMCKKIYHQYFENTEPLQSGDLLSLAIVLDDAERDQLFTELLEKKINKDRAEKQLLESIKKILDRNWMYKREELNIRMQSGECSEDETMALLKEFNELNRNPPRLRGINEPLSH